eukprot:TRINITY_DN54709_c0_g1_i1.p1 TRINITY_DN54709_c0_g1~~TRINITY_DN54709_c0_g1_i1.p1  ORF type:complete len:268 (-),score=47.40 TRINITY_DN54709_c0_g1_i1:37-747(-)
MASAGSGGKGKIKVMKARKPRKPRYKPSKPQKTKKALRRLAKQGSALALGKRKKPLIVREGGNCAGLVLGQAPPGPRSSLPRGWKPLAGPAEQRLAKLAGMKDPSEFWQEFDRANLLGWYPGLKRRASKHEVSKGYKKHASDGDVFPIADAKAAASTLDLSQYGSVILLGNNVARAFGVKADLLEAEMRGTTRLLTFPHPSGVSHFWNTPSNVSRAAKVMKSTLSSMRKKRQSSAK